MKPSIIFLLLFFGFATENSFAQPKVGEPAPKIQFSTVIGKPRTADFTKGKYVVLEFWATWCGPCIAGFPHFNSLIKQFASDSVLFVAMTDETNVSRIKDFLATRAKLDAINLLDDNKKTWKAFNISTIPTTVVIDKNANVLWTGTVTDLTAEKLGNLLKGKDLPSATSVATVAPKEESQEKINIFEFSVRKVYTAPANWGMRWGINAKRHICYTPYTSLVFSLAQVYNMPSTRVFLSKELMDYPMLELNFAVDTTLERKNPNMMPELLLKTLNISAKVVPSDTMVWQMTITDRKLLNKYKSVQYGHGGYSSNETQVVLVNNSFHGIGEYLEDNFKTVVIALPDASTKINGEEVVIGYDLIMPKVKSFDELNTWLKKNIGIHFVKQLQSVKFLHATSGEGQSVTSGR